MSRLNVLSFPGDLGPLSNPYIAMIAAELSAREVQLRPYRPFRPFQRADVLHIHWLERVYQMRIAQRHPILSFLAFAILYVNIVWTKAFGGRIVWTAHNLRPHDGSTSRHAAVWRFWSPKVYRHVDAVICMTPSAIEQVRQAIPQLAKAVFYVAPHPHYRGVYRDWTDRAEVRQQLGLPAQAILLGMIGYIRPYKGISEVVALMAGIADRDVHLLVAGRCPDEAYLRDLRRAATVDERIIVREGSLTNPEFAGLVGGCDLCVFNFSDILNSGSVVAALSLNRRVLAPAKGAVLDLAAMVGPEWLTTFAGNLDAETLHAAAIETRTSSALEQGPDLTPLDPARVASIHVDAYRGTNALVH